jgi:hypothetical protein
MNADRTKQPADSAFQLAPALVRSVRWGLIATLLLGLLSFVPAVGIVPHLIVMASASMLSLFWMPAESSFWHWSIFAAFVLCTLLLAALRLVHLFVLHQLALSNAPGNS